jgi:lipoprotein-anchoring transpeptidase ErfK/SrfK
MDRMEQGYSRREKKKQKKEIERSKQVALVKCMTAVFAGIVVITSGLWFGMQYVSGSAPVLGLKKEKESTGKNNDSKEAAVGERFCRLLPNQDRGDEPEGSGQYAPRLDKQLIIPSVQNAGAMPACRIVVNVPSRTLDFYNEARLVKTYPLAIGKPSTPTPLGSFTITQKEVNPWWYPPKGKAIVPSGPNNPLGYRWMGFAPLYGIHGTNTPWEIGGWVSNGCVRMREGDVEELFELVPNGTVVYINYDLVKIDVNSAGQVSLGVYPDLYRLKKEVTVSEVQRNLAENGVPNFVTQASLQNIVSQHSGQQIVLLEIHKLKVNGKLLSGQAVVSEGHVFVPVWEVAMALKTNVVWDEQQQTVDSNSHKVPGVVRGDVLYAAVEGMQTLFGGMWQWQPSENTWELVTLKIGIKQ